ncbi:hypothetical protein Desor_4365 [Desulfosporosinus orientis DSM 765]|uniref:Uncharacterized protein n=1 Tax=Desulfosporosinus orientis (strain ATCC 19365 / DSM 765 / NCIMB 8382 / VKM B-1628 / Singapore I) TaxID=768706 RepID=G7WJD1_DESOD|nr:hypothetical protein [Desulfosporosinus orientis]AET69790.1 hypothetical protein Desor_4365 [Desulfosporosinus orientis DSM 765]
MKQTLLGIREHAACLSYLIGDIEGQTKDRLKWNQISEWLDIASGIKKVSMNSAIFKCNEMCSQAWEYDFERDSLLSKIVTQITIFNFVWGALESLIDYVSPKDVPTNRGKVNAICDYLNENYKVNKPIVLYNDVLAELLVNVKKVYHYSELEEKFKLKSFVNLSGVGLQVVYKIRNKFSHGSLCFSEPEEWNLSKPVDDKIVNLATRIVLLSIQMVLITLFYEESIMIQPYEWGDEEVDLLEYLNILHLEVVDSNDDNQLSLFN